MSGCSRHQTGGALGEQDQSKCPCRGMSPMAVSFNNPGLLWVEVSHKDIGLSVNAHLLKRNAIKSVIIRSPVLCNAKLKLQKAFQGMSLYLKCFLVCHGHGHMCKSLFPSLWGPNSKSLSVDLDLNLSTHKHFALLQQVLYPLQLIVHTDASKIQQDSSSNLSLRKKKPPTHCCSVTGRVNDVGRWRGCVAFSAGYQVAVFGPFVASWRVTCPDTRNAVTDVPSDASTDSRSSSA